MLVVVVVVGVSFCCWFFLILQLREHDKTCLSFARFSTLTIATVRRSGVSSLLPPNEDIPLSFSMNSMSGSESIKSSIFTVSVSTFAALFLTLDENSIGLNTLSICRNYNTETLTNYNEQLIQFSLSFN